MKRKNFLLVMLVSFRTPKFSVCRLNASMLFKNHDEATKQRPHGIYQAKRKRQSLSGTPNHHLTPQPTNRLTSEMDISTLNLQNNGIANHPRRRANQPRLPVVLATNHTEQQQRTRGTKGTTFSLNEKATRCSNAKIYKDEYLTQLLEFLARLGTTRIQPNTEVPPRRINTTPG